MNRPGYIASTFASCLLVLGCELSPIDKLSDAELVQLIGRWTPSGYFVIDQNTLRCVEVLADDKPKLMENFGCKDMIGKRLERKATNPNALGLEDVSSKSVVKRVRAIQRVD